MSRILDSTFESHSSYERFDDVYIAKQQCSFRVLYVALSVGCVVGFAALLLLSISEKINHEKHFSQRTEGAANKAAIINESLESPEQSRIELVEGIPLDMDYGPNATFGTPLYKTWKSLLSMATKRVEVASFYWSMTGEDIHVNTSTDAPGRDILNTFKALPSRNVSVHIVASYTCVAKNSTDLKELEENGVHVRKVNFRRLTNGVLHSKFWIIDRKHIYIGSPNMDWRALTQVKELGVVIYDSPRLAHDLIKIFDSYWMMSHRNSSIPDPWPVTFDTTINHERPLLINLNGVPSSVYISASPPAFCPESRSRDLDAILSAIEEAEHFIYVAVMDYFPTTQFSSLPRYWPAIDDALREAAFGRHVAVRLLVSCGRNTDPAMLPFLQSLDALHYPPHHIRVEVKAFIVPVVNHSSIPYTRVNHNKYMVTDKLAYVGTSNWSEEYFRTTAGVGIVITPKAQNQNTSATSFHQQLKAVFLRDWDSPFTVALNELHKHPDCKMPIV